MRYTARAAPMLLSSRATGMPKTHCGCAHTGLPLARMRSRERRAAQPLADVNGSASYLGWGWLSISVPNLIVILVMILLFGLAIMLQFPKHRQNR